MSQIARGSYKAAVTVAQIPKPSGIGGRELLARRFRLANQNTLQWNVLQRNLSAVYSGLEEKTYQLGYCQKSPNAGCFNELLGCKVTQLRNNSKIFILECINTTLKNAPKHWWKWHRFQKPPFPPVHTRNRWSISKRWRCFQNALLSKPFR